jgi:hypothetical protein
VISLLIIATIIVMLVLGWQRGVIGERHLGATIGFTLLVGLVLWVTLDLNQPSLGLIRVSQEPIEQLLESMP